MARAGSRSARLVFFTSIIFLIGCKSTPDKDNVDYYSRPLPDGQLALERIEPWDHPDFSVGFGDRESLSEAIDQSLDYYAKPSSRGYFPYDRITHDQAVASLEALAELLDSGIDGYALNRAITERFDVYRSVGCDGRGTVLFTGYCEPIFKGSLTPTDEFRFPLYRLPEDLVKGPEGKCMGRRLPDGSLTPYATRAEIDGRGFLRGRDLELVWLASELDAYVVHVQGSARIELPDGRQMRVGYAGKTDRPYRSLGQKLIDDGEIPADDLSLPAIREFFAKHPSAVERSLHHNESYVFFTETTDGPYGSLNAKVTAMRSIATDKSVFPRGAMAFIDTDLPKTRPNGSLESRPYRGFVLDQDTGGAIRSAGRCDVFIGTGPQAERLAGHTKAEGQLYYLFLKEDEQPIPSTAAAAP